VVRREVLADERRRVDETRKSKDITGGLPRVAELFEARRPKDAAVVSEVDGIVEFGGTERGNRKLVVRDEQGVGHEYLIPLGKHLRVHEGDRVRAGDRLSEGAIDPHDILSIMGENAVQRYLLDEIQSVYRLQGVTINDKHIEVLKEINPSIVQVSLYSMKAEEHDAITLVKGSFEKTKNAIERLVAADIPVQISCPVMKLNRKSYKDVLVYANKLRTKAYTDFIMMAQVDQNVNNLAQRISIPETAELLIVTVIELVFEPPVVINPVGTVHAYVVAPVIGGTV